VDESGGCVPVISTTPICGVAVGGSGCCSTFGPLLLDGGVILSGAIVDEVAGPRLVSGGVVVLVLVLLVVVVAAVAMLVLVLVLFNEIGICRCPRDAPYPPVAVVVVVEDPLASLLWLGLFFINAGDLGTGWIIFCATIEAVTTSKVRAVNWCAFGGNTTPL
jgi:hypothetical protein